MLRRRGNIWVWIIGIPVILGALAHWGFHYFVKSKVDALILEAAPKAAIHYESLDTSLGGRVSLGNVSIIPTGFDEGLEVRLVQLQGPDVFSYLVRHLPLVGEEGPPDFLELVMRDIVLDISGDKATALDEKLGQDGGDYDVCQASGSASFRQLQELGMDQLRGNSRFGYRHIASSKKLYLDAEGEFRDMYRMNLSLELNNVPALDMRKTMGVALANLKMNYYVSPDFGRRVAEYCADREGLTVDQYSERFADEMIRDIRSNGIMLGYGLTWALKKYVKNWGDLMIELSPPRPVGLATLMNLSRAELSEKLGLQLAINGQLVTDLYFSINENAPLLRKSGSERRKRIIKPRIRYSWEYRKVAPARLSAYLDHLVRIRTADGVLHQGVLVGVDGRSISVQKKISGGKFIAHLARTNVRSAEVRVRVKIEPENSAAQEADSKKADAGKPQAATEQGETAGGKQ
ncbi:hypothetical protein [Thiolapillus sp.]